jgi:prepilin-type N-terminal cleavage/methylation domain-containing protein
MLINITKYKAKLTTKHSGFTIIELLVVMAIVVVLMGLVGPMTLNSIDKAEGKTEKITLENWLSKVSVKAFTTGNIYLIDLSAKNITLSELTVSLGNSNLIEMDTNDENSVSNGANHSIENIIQPLSIKAFKYLSFPKQRFTLNNRGFIAPESLRYQYNEEIYTIDLSTLINGESKGDSFNHQLLNESDDVEAK